MSEVFMAYDRWGGLVTIVLGVYMTLLAYGYLPRKPKDPEKLLLWRKKFGGLMQVVAPLVILGGLGTLIIGLSSPTPNPSIKRVFAEIAKANEGLTANGRSLQSGEIFLTKLKAIDLRRVPTEFAVTMRNYTDALADCIDAIKAGKPTATADAKLTAAQQRLKEAAKRNGQ